MADVSIFMMTKWFHYHVLCSANRGLTDEWNDTTQLLLDAAHNAQSPELIQVLAQNILFQYSVLFLPTRISSAVEKMYFVCACVFVLVCVRARARVCVSFVCLFVSALVYVFVLCVFVFVCVCVCSFGWSVVLACMFVFVCVYVFVFVCVYVFVFVCLRV